jgi:hypothetical protein
VDPGQPLRQLGEVGVAGLHGAPVGQVQGRRGDLHPRRCGPPGRSLEDRQEVDQAAAVVEFAVSVFVNPILLRLPAGPVLEARADGARVLGRVMPFWCSGSLLLTAWLAAVTRGGRPGPPPPRT